MRPTPISREIIDRAIDEYGIIDYANATIREVKAIAERAERESGKEFIKMEMGIPGLPAAKIGVEAQIKALQNGCARLYPALPGEPMIKDATSRFIKAFIDIDIPAECCIPTVGSMQGTFASLLTITQSNKKKNKALFIDPGFPVQKLQLEIQDVPYETFDIYEFRGKKLRAKLEEYMAKGDVCCLIYSNPNNPAWICLTDDELRDIGELATKYDVIVLEDLAYFAMDFRLDISKPFEPPFQPSVAKYTDNYIMHISGSKAFSYAGERIAMACISPAIFNRHYPDLSARYDGLPFGKVFVTRTLYALSSGTSHSAQYALAAIMDAASNGEYHFRDDVIVYGERAHKLKEIFTRHGFRIVYGMDGDQPIADGFYFTIGYGNMTSGQLARELMYYGVSAICLATTGSWQEGLRVCTSFIQDHQYDILDERMAIFAENNPID